MEPMGRGGSRDELRRVRVEGGRKGWERGEWWVERKESGTGMWLTGVAALGKVAGKVQTQVQ